MTKKVMRFVVDMRGRGEECVLASDYDSLDREFKRLSQELDNLHISWGLMRAQRDAALLQTKCNAEPIASK